MMLPHHERPSFTQKNKQTKGKIIVLYVLNFTFLAGKLEGKRFCTE